MPSTVRSCQQQKTAPDSFFISKVRFLEVMKTKRWGTDFLGEDEPHQAVPCYQREFTKEMHFFVSKRP
jgi:hypothetical protein